jgi:CRISPR/Cas system-associated exonuclease Cas4 (RecB family)
MTSPSKIKLYIVMQEKSRENYLRVTHMLWPFSGLQSIDADIVAHAAERGTRVHKVCEGIVKGLGEVGVDDEIWGYVESFKKWWALGHKVVLIENRFWDDELKITGQIDFMLDTPEGLVVADLKTSSQPSKTWPVQASAYAYLAKNSGYDVKKALFIHLNKHGKEPKIYEYPINISFFFAVLSVYKHFWEKDEQPES